ncbi:MAG: DMT family transporter [Mariprofundus sp.]|nr:DMT family transporter [Mariprofundus sp.]
MNTHTNTSQHHHSALIGMALALSAALFFSIKAIFVKLAYQHGVDAITLLTLRMAFALPVFVVVAIMEQGKAGLAKISPHQAMSIIGLGLVGYYLASMLDFVGLQYVSASIERLILFLFPTFTVLLSMLLLGRKISRIEIGALILSYIGIALSVQQEISLDGENSLFGVLLIFGSSMAYAVYLIGSGELIPRIGSRRFMALAMIVSCLAVLLQFFISRDMSLLIQPIEVYGYGLAIALFSTVLPAFMLAAAIHHIGASHSAIIGGIGPVATIILAVLILGESMTGIQVGGALLVVAGVLLLGLLRKP